VRSSLQRIFLPVIGLMVVLGTLSVTAPRASAQSDPFYEPTALPNERPDRCEPNDQPDRECVLERDAVSGPFTMLPEGDRDYYSVDLGAEPGLSLEVTLRATAGLDLHTTIFRAGEDTPLTTFSTPAISTTLTSGLAGWLVIRVENRAPTSTIGESYSIELRHVLPPPPPQVAGPDSTTNRPAPDQLENNWNEATAAPIGVGVVYDLNFTCPVNWGCEGGDHDYLAVPVKSGVRYQIATFDLGPGVDTVLDLYWGDTQTPVATSDDAYPGASFLSALDWRAPGNGTLLVRVGPRTGGSSPLIFEEGAGTYRLMVALAESDLGRQLSERVQQQSGVPPSPTVSASNADGGVVDPAGTPPTTVPSITADAPQGSAVVVAASTVMREGPNQATAAIQTLQQEARVTLLGQASGAWVRVQPEGGVVPGWVHGPDLHTLEPAAEANSVEATPVVSPAPVTPEPAPAARLPIVATLEPLPPAPSTAESRAVLTVEVHLFATPGQSPGSGTRRITPPPDQQRPLGGVRVQLVTVFGDVLAEALTPASGVVTLTRDLPVQAAVLVRLPALGLQFPVDRSQPTLAIAVPEGAIA
jgi:hypothetical protein